MILFDKVNQVIHHTTVISLIYHKESISSFNCCNLSICSCNRAFCIALSVQSVSAFGKDYCHLRYFLSMTSRSSSVSAASSLNWICSYILNHSSMRLYMPSRKLTERQYPGGWSSGAFSIFILKVCPSSNIANIAPK